MFIKKKYLRINHILQFFIIFLFRMHLFEKDLDLAQIWTPVVTTAILADY